MNNTEKRIFACVLIVLTFLAKVTMAMPDRVFTVLVAFFVVLLIGTYFFPLYADEGDKE